MIYGCVAFYAKEEDMLGNNLKGEKVTLVRSMFETFLTVALAVCSNR